MLFIAWALPFDGYTMAPLVFPGFCLLFGLFCSPSLWAQTAPPRFTSETIADIAVGAGLALGEVDGDGKLDILVADAHQQVWYRNGDWQRFVMTDSLTEFENVCLAARDINGDGKVEVAVGAQWNPGETTDDTQSGSVHYLVRPEDPTQPWQPVALHHEPTVHRMRWVSTQGGHYQLVVVPLHGRGNVDGSGKGVKVMAYQMPDDPRQPWDTVTLDQQMHLTHNLDILRDPGTLLVAGKEGVKELTYDGAWHTHPLPAIHQPAGEVRQGWLSPKTPFIATVEPMHGTQLVVYKGKNYQERLVLYDDLQEGHALACADLLGLGRDQIIIGWRKPNREGKIGLKIYVPVDTEGDGWMHYLIDDDIATEDLRIADMDNDGDLDIVATGRATQNLKIYWNEMVSH